VGTPRFPRFGSEKAARKAAFALWALLIALIGPAYAAPKIKLEPETFKLDNGLLVVVLPDHRAPVVTQMVWYRTGAADEPPGVSGIAHFLEHLMFRGTPKVPDGQFSKIVAKNGGEDNAFTTRDYTAYFENVAVDRLPLVMEMEADRMHNLALTPDIVTTERKVIIEERRMRTDNEPTSLLSEQMLAVLHLSHPYGLPTIGWLQDMERLSLDEAIDFYKKFYAPNNAILILAGDVTASQVRPMVEKFFGPIPQGPKITRDRPLPPPQASIRRLVIKDARATLPVIQRYYAVPSYTTAKPGEAEALEIAADVLGGGETSRLYNALVVEQQIATAAGASYSGSALNETEFSLYASLRDGVSPETAEAAMDKVLAKFLAEGPTAAELARSKAQLAAAAIYVRDSQQGMGQMFGDNLSTGQSIRDIVEWPDRIEAVRAAAVKDRASAYLKPERSVTGTLLPLPGANGKPRAPAPPMPATGPIR
jgi:zinc protease